jgi:hypothetical protein
LHSVEAKATPQFIWRIDESDPLLFVFDWAAR